MGCGSSRSGPMISECDFINENNNGNPGIFSQMQEIGENEWQVIQKNKANIDQTFRSDHRRASIFHPLDNKKKMKIAMSLGLKEESIDIYLGEKDNNANATLHPGFDETVSITDDDEEDFLGNPVPLKPYGAAQFPTRIQHVRPDGNCLFRAFSSILFSTEEHHEKMRLHIVNHMLDRPDLYEDSLLLEERMDEYILRTSMGKNGKWGTDVEIFAAATLFDVPIAVYGPYGQHRIRWQTFYPLSWEEHERSRYRDASMYIANNGEHYDVVLDV